ncbi:MAG TPA: bacillithiol biosynthesis BshC [Gemmatimonadaceae bacterium]|nr:bacillithiol biosynthesis BshC [Gemmatimonadaceae bacterium]
MTDVRIITEPLGGSALSRALQERRAPVDWTTSAPSSARGWRERAAARTSARDWTSAWRCLEPALGASGAARARLQRVIDANGVVVTTGQQPGLFGGPLYTLSKAVSAIALADALEEATGVPTVPVFWAATDDADFAEASTTVVARQGGLEVLRSGFAPPAGTPMALAPLGDLGAPLERLVALSGSAADPRALELVRTAYGSPAGTVGSAFVQLMRGLLEPLGMPVLDASHDGVWAASATVLRRALAGAREIEAALRGRAAAIRAAGFEPQVEDVPGLSLVFAREGTLKRRLSIGETADGMARLTPNVLLRPVVEHEVLPTVAYVAGPGELAYFAQVGPVASALSLDAPVAVPRWSCTLVEPQVAGLMRRLDATERDLTPDGALESRLARGALDADATAALERLRETLAALPGWMRRSAESLDLERAVQGSAGAMLHRADRLERRLLAAVKRRETALMSDVATLRACLRPRGKRQERALNPVPILARQGMSLIDEMRDAARPHARSLVSGTAG